MDKQPLRPTEAQIKTQLNLMGWDGVIDAVQETFIEEAEGRTWSPPKIIKSFLNDGDMRWMPSCMDKYPWYIGCKEIGAFTQNPQYGLPLAMGNYTLRSTKTGRVLMECDANITTAWRTAAASAVAVRALSDPLSAKLGMIGLGQQSYYHRPAIMEVRSMISETLVYDLDPAKMADFINYFDNGVVIPSNVEEIVNECDIVVTSTPTTEPHLWVTKPERPMMICAIGGDSDRKIEWAPDTLAVVDHYCDSLEQASHTGVVSRAIKQDIIDESDLKSLGAHLIGKTFADPVYKVKMFLSTGVALQDYILAVKLYERMRNKS